MDQLKSAFIRSHYSITTNWIIKIIIKITFQWIDLNVVVGAGMGWYGHLITELWGILQKGQSFQTDYK